MITYQDVHAARDRIAPYIVRTPLLRVPALDEALGCQVYLKHEGFQPMGAFKLRGAYNKLRSLTEEERAVLLSATRRYVTGCKNAMKGL